MSSIKNVKRHIPLRIRLFLKLVTNINSLLLLSILGVPIVPEYTRLTKMEDCLIMLSKFEALINKIP